MNYTKGEWIADIRVGMVTVHVDDKERFNCLDATQNECIYVRHGYRGKNGWEVSPEDIANAHLIAAAPEMYEALKATSLIVKTFNEMLLRHATDTEIVGVLDALFDNPIWEQSLAKAEGK